jgi:hypothetical protein
MNATMNKTNVISLMLPTMEIKRKYVRKGEQLHAG